jgi:hypothetical protein
MREARWLADHRGRAYTEQYGQTALTSLNVAVSNLAWLDIAELSRKTGDAESSREALANFRANWPGADKLPGIGPRMRALGANLAAGSP